MKIEFCSDWSIFLYVQSGDSLALGVLTVQGGILDDTFEEHAEGAARLKTTTKYILFQKKLFIFVLVFEFWMWFYLIVDKSRKTLDTTTTSHTTDRRLCNALNVLIHNLYKTHIKQNIFQWIIKHFHKILIFIEWKFYFVVTLSAGFAFASTKSLATFPHTLWICKMINYQTLTWYTFRWFWFFVKCI